MSPRHILTLSLSLAAVLCLAGRAAAEVIVLDNGDRITGIISSRAAQRVRLQTPHGVLTIPIAKVTRIIKANGSEEVLGAADTANPPIVALVVTGHTFWQAWDEKEAPADPSLRLELRLDDRPVASWTDTVLETGEIRGAVVNTFSFLEGQVKIKGADGVVPRPAEIQPGRIQIRVYFPTATVGSRRVHLVYQGNDGTVQQPAWRDIVATDGTVELTRGKVATLRLAQDRGQMEYAGRRGHKRMNLVETFGLAVSSGE